MAGVAPQEGELLMLKYILNVTAASDHILRLYKNDITPDDNSVYADFTEVTEAGYVPKTLVGANWTFTQGGGDTIAIYSEETFTFSTSADVYGFYITNGTDVLWAERFGVDPYTMPIDGGAIAINTQISLD